MHLQPLHPISHRESWTAGEVAVDPTAVVAPGVLLQADPGCRIRIGPGAVIGMGTVVHAHGGAIDIGAGVNVGAAVLLIGRVTVGDRACLGSQATVMNTVVNMGQTIAPGAMLGVSYEGPTPQHSPSPAEKSHSLDDASKAWNATSNSSPTPQPAPHSAPPPPSYPSPHPSSANMSSAPSGGAMARPMPQGVVYGKVQLERLMVTMFPHRNSPPSNASNNANNGDWENGAFNNNQNLHRDEWEE